MKNFTLTSSASLDFNQQNQNSFSPSTLDRYSNFSRSEGTIARNISLQNENLLNYSLNIGTNHSFDALLGLSFMRDLNYLNMGSGKGGPSDYLKYVREGWGNSDGLLYFNNAVQSAFRYQSNLEEQVMMSYFGRFRYSFMEKYLFETTLRRDGSSVFGENVRWATFPSFSAGWIIKRLFSRTLNLDYNRDLQ